MTKTQFRSSLDHLMDHDCESCSLHQYTDRVCVGGDGDPTGGIMILGEAPGGNEERTGRVFSGRAGEVLDAALDSAGLERGRIYVSNVVKCRPPDNATPDRIHWEACRQYLESEVEAVDPSHVLLLGNTALRAVWRRSGITKNRGVRLDCKDPLFSDRTVMATVHPAYVLRNPGQSSVFTEDIRRFGRAIKGEFQVQTVNVRLVRTAEGVRQLRRKLNDLPDGTVLAYDVENRGRPWEVDWAIVCLGLSWDGETTYVVPLSHPQSPFRGSWRRVLSYLRPALERPGLKLAGQNAKHDNLQLAGAHVYLRHRFDIMLAAHLVDENRPKNLGFLSQTYLGADVYKGMVETKPDKIMGEPIKKLCLYNGYDTGYTRQLYPKLRQELIDNPRLLRLFTKLMMPASHVIQEVEYRGVYVHQDRLWARMRRLQGLIDEQKEVLNEHLPSRFQREAPDGEFNFNSTQQLGRWLFSKKGLGLSPIEVTKSGAPSTKEAVLLHYHSHPAVRALLKYRTLQLKWMNTYLVPWSLKLDARSRLHTTYKLYGTVTGRLSGDLQQVPRDTFIRGVIGAPPGWLYVAADFSQIELRIAAHCATERRMQRAFLMGEDLHLLTAMDLTGKPAERVTKEERKKAKAVNFGFLYGMYPKKFQKYAFENYGVEVSLAEAEHARDKYFRSYPDLVGWHDRQKRLAHAYHRVHSPLGRVRHLPDILSPDRGVAMEAERQAINSPVQATASDLMLFAMIHLHKELNPHEAGMVITQHDEIGFEIREEMVGEYIPVIKQVMESLPIKRTFGFDPTVPIIADVEAADHWPGIPDASGLGITDY